ncbi:hypothetical protein SH601_07315 [Gracilibacillus sp. S3-1-1]|uniref:Uncharacterized protein n=1 Tax=Gracilibacillus pellucidus TaxID=3095368 RepID=A0ACC6M4P6_9BACI|nr:hypothetical protein [Gracilibacillus sp. S3-1-1]MDX8045797.1 hypothetical protein [Gracilibacillus sp. S3-1-1]
MKLLLIILPLFAFILNIFGLMRLIPLYFTIPLLFITIHTTLYFWQDKKQFKGFAKVHK